MRDRIYKHQWPDQPADHRVVVLGASPKPARYSNQAIRQLKTGGYQITPVHPKIAEIEGIAVTHSLAEIHEVVHTLTLYVGPQRSQPLIDDIIRLNPGRVILNPGTESVELEKRLKDHRLHYFAACTLVMLRTGQF